MRFIRSVLAVAAAGAVLLSLAPAPAAAHPRSRSCVNTAENYVVDYPSRWFTTQIRPEEACAQFHPSRFTIPPESEYPLTALTVRRVEGWPSRVSNQFERVLRWDRVRVQGRSAVRVEVVSTGEGMEEKGTRRYGYVLRLAGGLISVYAAAAPGEHRYRAWKSVADRAVRTLRAAPAGGCVPFRPASGFYEAGRRATAELTTPVARCSTVSVSHVVDAANPADRCQTFLVGFWPLVDGSLTYTEPVTACGNRRTVLARGVPDNARYIVLYDIDYLDPRMQTVRFKVWH